MAPNKHLRLVDDPPTSDLQGVTIDLDDGPNISIDDDGVSRIEHDDGSVTFDDGLGKAGETGDEDDFFRNLANEIAEDELGRISSDLLTGIELDQQSRSEWLQTRATAIKMLGLKIEEPSGDMSPSTAPVNGMSTIRHPLLLEATIRFQATARGELLPAAGPVKVRNDMPMRPDAATPQTPPPSPLPQMPGPQPGMPPAPPPQGEQDHMDDLATALEKDFNHFLTSTASEYVPDTDRMLFYVGFGGDGFKKVYNHPIKRRPVSETVDAEDIIVSNAATDIRNCGRVSHRIKMRPSMVRRMQIDGYYRDVPLGAPNPVQDVTAPEREKADVAGQKPQAQQPKDADYEIYECYCELDIEEFAPKQFKDKQLPLPYVVTIEKQSRAVLAVRRNWDEDDEQCLSKQFFVQFPFIRGLGFYGLGLIHILGNVTMALTAMWRIMIDAGMFANFPGWLFAKSAGRQNSNNFRVPAGGGAPVDVPPGMKLSEAFMPIPYKEPGTAFMNLASHVEEVGQRLGQTAELNIGEGKQEMPVGTTMALIEQATKIMDSVHKRLHAAQAEEFALLKERFREDPEAFWRHNKRPSMPWQREQFLEALNSHELVPVADPNNPTSLHRIAKATIVDMLVTKYPQDMDKRNALKRILRIADIDADGLLLAQTAPAPPDPRMAAVQTKAQAEQMKAQIDQARLLLEQQKGQAEMADKVQERAFKERMQQFEMHLEQLRVQAEMIIHAHDLKQSQTEHQQDMVSRQHELVSDHVQGQADMQRQVQQHQLDIVANAQKHRQEIGAQQQKHEQTLAADRVRQTQQIQLEREKHQADIENQRKIAEAKAEAIGPTEEQRAEREGEQHEQKMQIDMESHERAGEKHKVDLTNSKKLTDAKAKAMLKPKPAGGKK